MEKNRRICAKIDLDAIEYNVDMMKNNLQEGVKMIAVIKTDGYGHGALPIANMLEERQDIWGYAVATADEATTLRSHNVLKPILVLGCVFPEQYESAILEDIRITIYDPSQVEELCEVAKKVGKKALCHIKLDTGMGRLGFQVCEDSVKEIRDIASRDELQLEGLFTHFAKADEIDKTYTIKQVEGYLWMKEALLKEGVAFDIYHCSNSAGIIDHPEYNMDVVRAGISLYGLYPSEEVIKDNVPLKPALELISHVTFVKWIDAEKSISYGGTFVSKDRMRVATIPVGYGDGYPRSLSNKGFVLIHGKKAPILGRVCMDQFMVDVTDIPDVKFGDKVVLVGRDGEAFLPVETLSDLSHRFNYEFVCDLSKRIPREYIRHGKVVEEIDFFENR